MSFRAGSTDVKGGKCDSLCVCANAPKIYVWGHVKASQVTPRTLYRFYRALKISEHFLGCLFINLAFC